MMRAVTLTGFTMDGYDKYVGANTRKVQSGQVRGELTNEVITGDDKREKKNKAKYELSSVFIRVFLIGT